MLTLLFSKKKKKVMIIDDDQNILKMYGQILGNHADFDVILASNKESFMKHIEEVDAVVSDFHMKEVTGITFARVLDICDNSKIPVLLITGDIYPYYDYQLSKPVSGKTLKSNIEKMLERGYVASKKRPPRNLAA